MTKKKTPNPQIEMNLTPAETAPGETAPAPELTFEVIAPMLSADPATPVEAEVSAASPGEAPAVLENEEPAPLETAPAAPIPSDWVTFIPDPFGLPSSEVSSEENEADGGEVSPDEIEDEEISDSPDSNDDGDLSLDQAASDFMPDALPLSTEELSTLQNLTVALAAQNQAAEEAYALSADAAPVAPAPHDEVAFSDQDPIAEAESALAAMSAAYEPADASENTIEAIAPDSVSSADTASVTETDTDHSAPTTDSPAADEAPLTLDLAEAQSCIEALLFMSDQPINAEKLHAALGEHIDFSLVQEALTHMMDRYQRPEHGFELTLINGGYQFRTKPGRAALAQKLAKVQTQKLSAGAMETLAIVAYKQPVMKEDIDQVRGVDSSYFVRALLDRKLIKMSGRSEMPGRPILYSTSHEFMELFGLKDLGALPSLREIEQMVPGSQVGRPEGLAGEDADPRIRNLRNLVGEMNNDPSGALGYNPDDDEQFLSDIREKVKGIPTSTPYLEQLAEQAKATATAEAQPALAEGAQIELPSSDGAPLV